MKSAFLLVSVATAALLAACSKKEPADGGAGPDETIPPPSVIVEDRFTYANYDEVQVSHLDLDLDVDFGTKTLSGVATLDLKRIAEGVDTLVLDTNDLAIESVETARADAWSPAEYALGEDDPLMGSRLEIALPKDADKVRIRYATSPGAEAIQWLSPEQTAGQTGPYLFSQNQAINARSMAPVQDTPAVRMTYSATIRTPENLLAVMSAGQDSGPRDGEYEFEMNQPIPIYLLALAVGDIQFKAISENIGVYSEAAVVDAAAAEFEDTPKMEELASAVYGPYRWDRYDMLVLPPSFPFGGMENPRLTFLTPTLLAGDKSLTNVVAHELAHSWSGNLVTNATWRDSWLNEGFTSYVENRIMEALYGEERAAMERALNLDTLKRAVGAAERPELTQLKLPEDLQTPDDAFSQVSYEKGAFFLKFLEDRFGREAFDPFLKSYFDHFAFQAIRTEDFLSYMETNLRPLDPEAVTDAEIDEWIYGQGIPQSLPVPSSAAFEKVSALQTEWLAGAIALDDLPVAAWTTHEWLHFINGLPDTMTQDQFAALDAAFDLSHAQNAEIAYAWYRKAIRGGYEPAIAPIEDFLMRVGRMKFIVPLYTALVQSGRDAFARRVYEAARPRYHPVAQRRVDEVLQ